MILKYSSIDWLLEVPFALKLMLDFNYMVSLFIVANSFSTSDMSHNVIFQMRVEGLSANKTAQFSVILEVSGPFATHFSLEVFLF